ncbi:hypothetical protein [Vibrio sp. T11.5]|uniref:hypothetical protein n=1 Tax=Vibrio sp. T11.5 TaxID=2998836 RepID=UPI0022CD8966|nr:hypothetical protein [Vibrio sp. T11.5]MDA0116979.1 hypothetical protein [Vibrio sp. T11.5]
MSFNLQGTAFVRTQKMQLGTVSHAEETSQLDKDEERNWLVSQPKELLDLDDFIQESWRQWH